MRVLHTLKTLSKSGAGLFYHIRGLTRWQRELGCDVVVVGLFDDEGLSDAPHWKHAQMELVPTRGPRFFPVCPQYGEILARLKPDLIHCHGLWTYHSLGVPAYCNRAKIPYIATPHGMLEPWAWRHHAWKKRPVWWLWEKRFLRRAFALQATADQELLNLRRLGVSNPVAVIPPGIDLPSEIQSANQKPDEQKTALFLSRIHPKKGLLDLVNAWKMVNPVGWRVVIAGPDENGHLAVVKKAVSEVGLTSCFEFVGPVYDSAKWSLYRSANLFILPTYSENFGIAVVEALGCGLPVITTHGAPWEELLQHKCGWWVEVGAQPLAAAIKEATSLPEEQRREMGRRGRLLVDAKYSWEGIANEMNHFYRWILGQGPPPASLRLRPAQSHARS